MEIRNEKMTGMDGYVLNNSRKWRYRLEIPICILFYLLYQPSLFLPPPHFQKKKTNKQNHINNPYFEYSYFKIKQNKKLTSKTKIPKTILLKAEETVLPWH